MAEEIKINIAPLKKHWPKLVLLLILSFGFYLRIYHIDYPVIGYHNWKETHYLTEARNFARDGFFKYGFFIPAWGYPGVASDVSGAHGDTFPTTSILVGVVFRIFGMSLLAARLVSVLFSLGAVVVMYLLVRGLSKREDLALSSAFVLTVLPLHIFFGRQVQLLSSALFFSLLGVLFFFLWHKYFYLKHALISAFFLTLGIITKYTFIVLAFPLLFMFPYKRVFKRENVKHLVVFLSFFAVIPLWIVYNKLLSVGTLSDVNAQLISAFKPQVIFSSSFWAIMKSFLSDNFTLVGVFFSFMGVVFLFLAYQKRKTSLTKFFVYYVLGSIIWFVFMAFKLKGHNYHQYPLLPLVAFLITYCFMSLSVTFEKKLKFKNLRYFFLFLLFVFIFYVPQILGGGIISSKDRMFDTQFPGLDIAGDYIRSNKTPSDMLVHSKHQAFGILWHSDIKGTPGIPKTSEAFSKLNLMRDTTWLFVYRWDFNILSEKDVGKYIKKNYGIRQVGFFIEDSKVVPLYFLLKRGGVFNENLLNYSINSRNYNYMDYEFSSGLRRMYYINL